MNEIWAGIQEAFWLIIILDSDLIEITVRSLKVSFTALVVASALALPFGTWLAIRRFRYRRITIAALNALMGLPPVVVGLIVYLLLSRSGPFGVLGLLFTPTAMIVAQVIIITPLIASITHQAMRELWSESRLIDFSKYLKTPTCSSIDLGRSAHIDDSSFGRFWTSNWRGWGHHDCGR
jgi:tungstate transport system permease protein